MSPTYCGGDDRKTLQRLYTALVQSKLDYGAQVYGASKSQVLKRLEPIQNACLRAITGAFHSSPAVSLCVDTGILPLDLSRDMLTLKHFFKTQSLLTLICQHYRDDRNVSFSND